MTQQQIDRGNQILREIHLLNDSQKQANRPFFDHRNFEGMRYDEGVTFLVALNNAIQTKIIEDIEMRVKELNEEFKSL